MTLVVQDDWVSLPVAEALEGASSLKFVVTQ